MAYPYPFTGPVAPCTNFPINDQYYSPRQFIISGVTRGAQTTITTSVDHDYVIGQQVRLLIPPSFGIRQLNEKTAFVISLPASNQVLLDISSANMDTYIASSDPTPAQILPIGTINGSATNYSNVVSSLTYIDGSFRDISPL